MIKSSIGFTSRLFLIASLPFGGVASTGFAQTAAQAITTAEPQKTCETGLFQVQHLNSVKLFEAGASCLQSKRYLDATFVLALGQIRGATDVSLFQPLSYQDARMVYGLSARVTYNPQSSGGFGHTGVYRDPAMKAELFRRLKNWNPAYSKGYDPGWRSHQSDLSGHYEVTLSKQKAYRLALLRNHSILVNDPEYYAAKRELTDLNNRTKGRLTAGSEDYKRWNVLRVRLAQLRRQIVAPVPKPVFEAPGRPTMDNDFRFKQIYTGWNGAARKSILFLENEAEVTSSWLGKALKQNELSKMLSKVDFSRQFLIAFGVGKRTNATGSVYFNMAQGGSPAAYLIMRVGVNEQACELEPADSYPFAVAVVERSVIMGGRPNQFEANFGDGCKPAKFGQSLD